MIASGMKEITTLFRHPAPSPSGMVIEPPYGEQIGLGIRGKPRRAHALPARSIEAMRSSALAKTVWAAALLPSSSWAKP
jgi:hypothetical protein